MEPEGRGRGIIMGVTRLLYTIQIQTHQTFLGGVYLIIHLLLVSRWDYNRTINTADLRKTWDYCRGHAPPPMAGWKLALIILGVGAGVALLTGLIYFFSR